MTKEPIALSEWIQFLISQKHHCHAWLIGYTTFLVALFSLIMLIIFALGTSIGILVCIPIFILYIWVLYQAFSLRPILKNSKTLLEDIMKENMTSVKQIKEKWFGGRKKMEDINIFAWKRIRDIALTSALGLLGISFFLMIYGTSYFPMYGIQWIGSIGIAILALGVALHSIVISKESDEKLDIIEEMNFNRLMGLLRERRLSLRGKMLGLEKAVSLEINNKGSIQDPILIRLIYEFEIYYCFSIWQSLVYLQQIDRLKERTSNSDKKLILHVIRNLFSDLKDGLIFLRTNYKPDYNLDGNYPGQIQSMFDIITNFRVHDEKKQQYEELVIFKHFLLEKIKIQMMLKNKETKKEKSNKTKKKTKE